MNKKLKIALFILAILFGPFLIVFGGYDDSPGAQMIGLIIFIVGVVGIIRNRKKNIK
jgi:Na+/melibiose symporter-like transporter